MNSLLGAIYLDFWRVWQYTSSAMAMERERESRALRSCIDQISMK